MKVFVTFILGLTLLQIVGCGPSSEQKEQWAIESCLEGNAKVNGIPKTVQESEAARKYCLEVYKGKY